MGFSIIYQAFQTNMPLLESECQILLSCVWFERTLISYQSDVYAFTCSCSWHMVCSEHHRPRGMSSCLEIINMSSSWADRQNILQHRATFLQTSDQESKCFHLFLALKLCLIPESYTSFDLNVTVILHHVCNLLSQVLWLLHKVHFNFAEWISE